jgi:hypothetical protein
MHDAAVKLMQQIAADNRTVIIPCEIFAETVNMLGKNSDTVKLSKQ